MSKLKIKHPAPTARELSGPRYWRSLDELTATPAFNDWLAKEFPSGASTLEGVDRRNFLKIMAASFGLAGMGLAGCRQQTRHLLPYSKQLPGSPIPGVPTFYASSQPSADGHIPLIVETHSARPTKVEGNPSYAGFGGATNAFAQASVLELYDPDRAQHSSDGNGAPITPAGVEDKLSKVSAAYSASGGTGLYVLSDKNNSPTRARITQKFLAKFPKAVWAEYEPLDQSNPERAATAYFGAPSRPVYDFSKAKRVVSLDSDFLHTEPGHIGYTRGFAQSRKIPVDANGKETPDQEKMVRLYAIESNFSLTGANADHRFRCATAQIPAMAAALLEVVRALTSGGNANDVYGKSSVGVAKVGENKKFQKWLVECATDLVAHKGTSVVIAGAQLSVLTHSIVLEINNLLGATGSTVTYRALPASAATASIEDVAKAIDAGQVKTLVILNGNPAYNAPGDLDFAAKLKKPGLEVIRYGYHGPHFDETSALATTFVAGLHYLESWGDGYTWDGFHVPVQPMIQPLFEGYGELDVIGILAGDRNIDSFTEVKATFAALHPNKSFEEWLAVGVAGTGFPTVSASGSRPTVTISGVELPTVDQNSFEVRFIPGAAWDGRYANNGWLQESPDPMTKLTWDNAILISPKLAKQLQILPSTSTMANIGQAQMNDNDFVTGREIARMAEVTVNGKTVRGPISILPGLADWTLVMPVGFGRKVVGNVGKGTGFSAYPLVKSGAATCSATGASFKLLPESETYRLANVQEHWSMEGRAIVREANVEEYKKEPEFVKEMGGEADSPPIYGPSKDLSPQEKSYSSPRGQELYQTHPSNVPAPNVAVWNTPEGLKDFPVPQQWGMSIDLNTCVGCTACLVACQSENNIPIVGKEQVMRGREMHWIRLDRYFAAGPEAKSTELPEDPQVTFQSVACQHCELAPCENVCPFMATVHDDQGLNTMAYNRCVGTKYCADNCPFKVRRFNFFDWNKREIGQFYRGPLGDNYYDTDASQLTRMQKNPEVSIRMRGVMEKCTYCIQRIESAKINQRVKARDSGDIKVPDGTIRPACVQACPTNAIVFGDVSDANSEVSKAKASDRNYAVLGYLDIRPRTTYLAKLRNPNPNMPDAYAQPMDRQEYDARYGDKPKAAEPAKTN